MMHAVVPLRTAIAILACHSGAETHQRKVRILAFSLPNKKNESVLTINRKLDEKIRNPGGREWMR